MGGDTSHLNSPSQLPIPTLLQPTPMLSDRNILAFASPSFPLFAPPRVSPGRRVQRRVAPHATAAPSERTGTTAPSVPDASNGSSPRRTRPTFTDGANYAFWCTYEIPADDAHVHAAWTYVLSLLRGLPLMSGPERTFWFVALRRLLFHHCTRVVQYAAGRLLFRRAGNVDDTPMDLFKPDLAQSTLLTYHALTQDLAHIRAGLYPYPWLQGSWMRELSGVNSIRMLMLYVKRKSPAFQRFAKADLDRDTWLSGPMYRAYYARTFHFQTDGWLSAESAGFYDFETEEFFTGTHDVMQRVSLVPLAAFFRRWHDVHIEMEESAENAALPHVLELACGTGRFATFIRDAFPRAKYTLSDASPFYLARAREAMREWESHSQDTRKKAALGSVSYRQALAEDTGLSATSVDAVFAQYVLHEMPPSARRAVVREAARVLRAGGALVLTDAAQEGEQRVLQKASEIFKRFDEPYYASYLDEDFVETVCGSGLFLPELRETRLVTKTMSFVRTEKLFS